jgi:hypothetical protein
MTEAKRRKRLIKEGEAAFRAEVDSWMPKPKVLKIGDRVMLCGIHASAGKTGVVAREVGPHLADGIRRAIIDLDDGGETIVTQADQWRKV